VQGAQAVQDQDTQGGKTNMRFRDTETPDGLMDESIYTISCDLCETVIGNERGDSVSLPDGVITINEGVNAIDICPKCRYAGAGAYIIEQQFADKRKVGIDIRGGLNKVYRSLYEVAFNISQAAYRIADLKAPDFDETEQRRNALRDLKRTYHFSLELMSIMGCVIGELAELGVPVYYREQDEPKWISQHHAD